MDEWRVGSSQCESSDRDRFLNVCIGLHACLHFFFSHPSGLESVNFSLFSLFFCFWLTTFSFFRGAKVGAERGIVSTNYFLPGSAGTTTGVDLIGRQ